MKAILINSAENSSASLLPEAQNLSEFCDAQHNWCPSAGWGYLNMTQAYAEYQNVQQIELVDDQVQAWFQLDPAQVRQLSFLKATAVWQQTDFTEENKLYPARQQD